MGGAGGIVDTTGGAIVDSQDDRPGRNQRRAWRRTLRHAGTALAAALLAVFFAPTSTGGDLDGTLPHQLGLALRKDRDRSAPPSDADPDLADATMTTLATIINAHTGEAFALSTDEPSTSRFSACLADRTTGASIDLDPRLLDLLRRLAEKNPGARIELVSGFRSPKLNEMLRKKGHNVASHSQHSLGHAVDFRIVGLTPHELRQQILDLGWDGGIGEYDKYWDNFVHADVGPKRYWFER